jgi:hypothetical protein
LADRSPIRSATVRPESLPWRDVSADKLIVYPTIRSLRDRESRIA